MADDKLYQELFNYGLALDHSGKFPKLNNGQKHFLSLVYQRHVDRQRLTIVEAMHIDSTISTSTAFRLINQLISQGYLRQELSQEDRRIKYLVPSSIATRYFSSLGLQMKKLVNQSG